MSHAKLSASGSSRWIRCPASINACASYPESTNPAAEYGTAAHELSEICLENYKSPNDYLDTKMTNGVLVDEEMVGGVIEYINYVQAIEGVYDSILIEQRLDFSHIVPEGFGTADLVMFNEEELHIVDLKFGKGIVHAENNSQLSLYALGALHAHGFLNDFKKVTMHIAQPRANHFDTWETTPEALEKWAEWVKERAQLALSDEAPYEPSAEACKYCAHQGNCVALKEHVNAVIIGDFENLEDIEGQVDKVDNDHIKRILDNMDMIKGFLEAVQNVALERMQNGTEIEGYKIVESKKNKAWRDETTAVKTLLAHCSEDDIYTKELCTPTQAIKLLGKKHADELREVWYVPEGQPVLAPITDKRPALGSVIDSFDVL